MATVKKNCGSTLIKDYLISVDVIDFIKSFKKFDGFTKERIGIAEQRQFQLCLKEYEKLRGVKVVGLEGEYVSNYLFMCNQKSGKQEENILINIDIIRYDADNCIATEFKPFSDSNGCQIILSPQSSKNNLKLGLIEPKFCLVNVYNVVILFQSNDFIADIGVFDPYDASQMQDYFTTVKSCIEEEFGVKLSRTQFQCKSGLLGTDFDKVVIIKDDLNKPCDEKCSSYCEKDNLFNDVYKFFPVNHFNVNDDWSEEKCNKNYKVRTAKNDENTPLNSDSLHQNLCVPYCDTLIYETEAEIAIVIPLSGPFTINKNDPKYMKIIQSKNSPVLEFKSKHEIEISYRTKSFGEFRFALRSCDVKFNTNSNVIFKYSQKLCVVMEKEEPKIWKTLDIGTGDFYRTIQLKVINSQELLNLHQKQISNQDLRQAVNIKYAFKHNEKISNDSAAEDLTKKLSNQVEPLDNSKYNEGNKIDQKNPLSPNSQARCRTLSDGDLIAEKRPLLNRTTSWPRGILKHRSRSLSESNVGSFPGFSSLNSSTDLDDVIELENEDSTSCENSVSSSFKKSVCFSDVVQKQTFRMNSSILGQRAKNQRKTAKKRAALERKLSESDSQAGNKENAMVSGSNTEEEYTDSVSEIPLAEIVNEGINTSHIKTCDSGEEDGESNDKCDKNKKKRKNKNKRKNKRKVDLSNEMIFQLDLE